MKIPKHIKNKLRRIAALECISRNLMREVEAWLEAKGFDTEELRSGDGCSLEEFENGNDITDEFCEKLELIVDRGETDD